jgi:hypothetical protein
MPFEIPYPTFLAPRRYALLIGDEAVECVRWTAGKLEVIETFSNDQAGLVDFRGFLESNKTLYSRKAFRIVLNIVGEDYRYELTPHLLGRYKTNFLSKRMHALYRGSAYTQSITLGREELGKRQDLTLFLGVLTEDKVAPWVKQLQRNEINIIGIYSQALALRPIMTRLGLDKSHAVLTLFTGGNSIRQCYFHQGQLRHSRVTKLPRTDSPTVLMKAISGESDRFQQYLTQLKIARGVRVEFRIIVPPSELQDFQKGFKSVAGDKADRYFFYDGEQVLKLLGVKQPLVEWGRDNSIGIQSVFRTLVYQSLASLDVVRFFWLRLVGNTMAGAVGLYAVYLIGIQALGVANIYFTHQLENQTLASSVSELKVAYENQVSGFVDPPSTPENMRAVSNIFSSTSYNHINPAPLLYYVSQAIQQNPTLIELDSIDWYLADEPNAGSGKSLSYLSGSELYQVVVLKGTFFERRDQTLEDALANVDRFLSGFEKRPDIEIELMDGPKPLDAESSVSGVAALGTSVVAASALTTLDFAIRISWKQRDAEFYTELLGERDANV